MRTEESVFDLKSRLFFKDSGLSVNYNILLGSSVRTCYEDLKSAFWWLDSNVNPIM